jgi:nitroreductase
MKKRISWLHLLLTILTPNQATVFAQVEVHRNKSIMSIKSSTIFIAAAAGFMGGIYWMKHRKGASGEKVVDESMSPEGTLGLIRKRRSIFCKQYTGEQVSPRVLEDMLEAARWAPSHHLTEAWHFVIFSSLESRRNIGKHLADAYKQSSEKSGKYSQAKYAKKLSSATKSSFVIALCCKSNTSSPVIEEICSMSCAVQNMHLVATSHKVGAYWSSSGIYANKDSMLENPSELMEFLGLPKEDFRCLGWMFVGDYKKEWPSSRRKPCSHTML